MREPPKNVVDLARMYASESPCAKSHRGVVIFEANEDGSIPILATGTNHPPKPFFCKGDAACRAACAKVCIHAEQDALHDLLIECGMGNIAKHRNLHIVHVEVPVDRPNGPVGDVVACDSPCCWQCSREILELAAACRIAGVWLYEEVPITDWPTPSARWVFYTPQEFHFATLRHRKNDLPANLKDKP